MKTFVKYFVVGALLVSGTSVANAQNPKDDIVCRNGNTVLDTSKDRRDNAHGIYYLARKGHVIDGFNLNNTFDPSNVSTTDVEDM